MAGGADFDVSLEVRTLGLLKGTREAASATKELTEETRRHGDENRKAKTAADELAAAERRRISAAAEMVRSVKSQITALAEYQKQLHAASNAEAARSITQSRIQTRTISSVGVDPSSRLGAAMQSLMEKERQLRAGIQETAAELVRADKVAGAIGGLQARTKAMEEALGVVKRGEAAERAYAAALALRKEMEATGARPGTDEAAAVEREVRAQQRLGAELRAVAAARERARRAAAEAQAQGERVAGEVSRLREATSQLEILAAATRKGAAATRDANLQLEIRNALLRVGASAGSQTAAAIEREIRAQERLRREMDEVTGAQRRVHGGSSSLISTFYALSAAVAALGLGTLVRTSVELVIQMERVERTFVAVLGSVTAAQNELSFVRAESDRLGLSFKSTAVAYSQFVASASGSLSMVQIRDVFSGVSEAMANLGIGAQQQQRALLALSQMAAKGVVSMEELRQQLGDALPRAMQLSADAMGMPLAKFMKLVGEGEILSRDLLPKLPAIFREAFGTGGAAIDNTQASLNRFNNTLDDLREDFGTGFLEGFVTGLNDLREDLTSDDLSRAAKEFGRDLGDALRLLIDLLGTLLEHIDTVEAAVTGLGIAWAGWKLGAVIAGVEGFAAALSGLWAVMAANPIGAILVAIGLLTSGLLLFINSIDDGRSAMSSFDEGITAWGSSLRDLESDARTLDDTLKRLAEAREIARRDPTSENRAFVASLEKELEAARLLAEAHLELAEARLAAMQVLNSQIADTAAAMESHLAAFEEASRRHQGGYLSKPILRIPDQAGQFFPDLAGEEVSVQQYSAALKTLEQQQIRTADAGTAGARVIQEMREKLAGLATTATVTAAAEEKREKGLERQIDRMKDLLAQHTLAAEAAERMAAAELRGSDAAARQVEIEERARTIQQALSSLDKVDIATKEKLAATLDALLIREQEAQRAGEATRASRERGIQAAADLRTAEAGLADAMGQTVTHSLSIAAALEAEAIARGEARSGDEAYIKTLTASILNQKTQVGTINLQIEAAGRLAEHNREVRQAAAELADATDQSSVATERLTVELLAEEEARKRGLAVGSLYHGMILAILLARQQEIASAIAATAAQERLNEAKKREASRRAGLADFQQQAAHARRYGGEITRILASYGQLSDATRELAIQEQILAAIQSESLSRTDENHKARIAAIEAEIRGQAAVMEQVDAYQASMEIASYQNEPINDAWRQTGETIKGVIADVLVGAEVDWDALLKNMLAMWADAMIEMLTRWVATQAAMRAVSVAAGTSGGVGGGISAGNGSVGIDGGALLGQAGTAMAGKAVAGQTAGWMTAGAGSAGAFSSYAWAAVGVAVVAAIMATIANQAKTEGRAEVDTSLRIGGPDGIAVDEGYSRYNRQGGLDRYKAQIEAVEQLVKGVEEFIARLGGQVTKLGAMADSTLMTIGREGQGSNTNWFVKMADGLVRHFGKDSKAAFEFAMIQAIKTTPSTGIDPIVKKAIELSTAETMEQFQQDVAKAQELATLGMDDVQVNLRDIFGTLRGRIADAVRLLGEGPELDAALSNIWGSFMDSLNAQRDSITGRQATPQEQLEQQKQRALLFNAELALMSSRLQAERADLIAKRDFAIAELTLTREERKNRESGLKQRAAALQAEAGMVMAFASTMGAVGASAIEAFNQQILAIDQVLAGLANIKPIDLSEIRLPGSGGGGGDRKQDRLDLLDEVKSWKLSEVGRSLNEAGRWFDDFKARIKDMGFSAAEQARIMAEAAAELARRLAEIKKDQLARSAEFIVGGTAAGGALTKALADNRKSQEDLIKGNRDLYKGGQLSLREMRELNKAIREAGERQRDQMIGDASSQLFMELYNLLGDEEAAAQLRYDLTLAELELRREELRLAMEVAGWTEERMNAILAPLGVLINRVREAGPALFGPGGTGASGQESAPLYNPPSASEFWDEVKAAIERVREMRRGVASQDPFEVERLKLEAEFATLRETLARFPAYLAELDATYAEVMADLARRRQERDDEMLRPYEELALDPFQREMQALQREFENIRETVGDTARVQGSYALALQDLMKQYSEGLRSWYQELTTGAASGMNAEDQYAAAMQRYGATLAQIQSGDYSKTAELEGLGRQLSQLAGQIWGTSTGGASDLRQLLRTDMEAIFELIDSMAPTNDSAFAPVVTPGSAPGSSQPRSRADEEKALAATREVKGAVDNQGQSQQTLQRETNKRLDKVIELLERVVNDDRTLGQIKYGSNG